MGTRSGVSRLLLLTLCIVIAAASGASAAEEHTVSGSYDNLLALFSDWRAFERPPLRDGAPDYTAATLAGKATELQMYQARLAAIDPKSWPVEQQVDYALVRAEMNGLDFDLRVLQPWARDPAFYHSLWTEQSDTPAHEGTTHDRLIELWTYTFPLNAADEKKLANELHIIPPLLRQAQSNLIGNAHDLWVTGIGTMQQQAKDLADLQ
jgi:hypothetical protein